MGRYIMGQSKCARIGPCSKVVGTYYSGRPPTIYVSMARMNQFESPLKDFPRDFSLKRDYADKQERP